MTEQEIITYLKENWNIGVAFVFMPREVRKWCEDNLLRTEIPFRKLVRDSLGYSWSKLNYDEPFYCEYVYCLSDDYEPKPLFKPHWEEFDIKNGYFYYDGKEYYYRDDVAFERRYPLTFKGFGGWLYENSDEWHLSPCVMDIDRQIRESYYMDNEDTVTPAYPKKIRFWRYKE